MLSRETEQKLIQIFMTLSLGEEKIDNLKKNNLTKFNINPIRFFAKLDKNKSNYLTKNDISAYLNSFSIIYTPTDIDYIFYFYDKDFDNVLNFYEFLDLLISNSNYIYKKSFKKKFKHNKISQNEINGEIENDIQKAVLQIYVEEIELARKLNNLIIEIKMKNDFAIQDIFYEIKSYSYITTESLKAFFDRNEVSYNDKFIRNIFKRFNNKEINDRISFNKFKNFFDLPFNKNIKENIINNNNFNQNLISPLINQTQISEDIKFNNSKTDCQTYQNLNFDEKINNNLVNIRNDLNEEDIQFECSHFSRSGSLNSKKEKNKKCGYCTQRNINVSYKNYLREKRSKSLEKSLSRSLSRKNQPYLKKKITENNKKDIRNIRVIADQNNNSIEDGINMSSNMSSYTEDIPVKLPIRLDKNLVKRKLPQKKINNENKIGYNMCYDVNNIQNNCFHHHHNCYNINNTSQNVYDKENRQYNFGTNEIRSSNNLDLKIYKEDIGKRINTTNFGEYKY